MKYLHTMVRVTDLDQSLRFYRDLLGLKEIRRHENEKGRYTLVFLAPPGQEDCPVELTYNWDPEVYTGGRNFGHLAYEVDDIYAFCDRADEGRRDHQSPAARRPHGLHPLARQHLGRDPAEGRLAAGQRAVDFHGQYRRLVDASLAYSALRCSTPSPTSLRSSMVTAAAFWSGPIWKETVTGSSGISS